MPDLCRQLTARREALGLSQADVAARMGRTQQWVSLIESKLKIEDPPELTVKELQKYAEALGVRLELGIAEAAP